MNRCERCLPLILDHLYGLLDGPDEVLVAAHLRDCAACSSARDEAARVQGLFAKAARGAFPRVRFEAPTAAPTASPAPALASPAVPAAAPGRTGWRVAAWLPWAVAAAVWLAIPGTVLPVLGVLDRAHTARTEVEQSVAQLEPKIDEATRAKVAIDEPRAAARRELAGRSQQLEAVLAKWYATEKAGATQARKTPVEVLKPASVQPGAPNDFEVRVLDGLAGGHSQLYAEIHEVRAGDKRTDTVIFSQPLKPQQVEPQPLHLPAAAWAKLTPQSELYLVVTSTDEKTRAATEVQDRIRLFGPVYATMLVTDKPTYRPGETVFFRSLTLDRTSFRPPEREQNLEYEFFERDSGIRLSNVKGVTGGTDLVRVSEGKVEPVFVNGRPIRGVGCGALPLPENLPDGDYTLVLRELPHPAGYQPAVPAPVARPIKVQSRPADIYQKHLGLSAAAFAAGDVVNGWAELKLQDQPVAGAEVQAIATVDDVLLDAIQTQPTTGPDGRVKLRFTLPRQLERGDVRLQVMFKKTIGKETVRETVTQRVPVMGRSVVVEFFPEGGNLVAGLPCRVYFRATTPAGQPVDIRGTITDGSKTIARVATLTDAAEGANRGIGSFTYTPALGTPVWLKLDAPSDIHAPLILPNQWTFPAARGAVGGLPAAIASSTGFLLPAPRTEGVVMTVLDPVTTPGQPVRVHLRSNSTARKFVVGAYTRGRLSDTQRIALEPGQVGEVALMASADPRGGVVRITVFEEPADDALGDGKAGPKPDLKPVAERLVFRKPGEALNLSFTTNGASAPGRGFAPGSPVELNLAATDEKGRPAAAILYAAAVNSGVAPGPKDRLLTTHFLIAGEITTPDAMEFADFLLTNHPKAGEVLDLVLATQGWRRFAEQTPPGYIRRPTAPTEECKNLLVTNGQYSVQTDPAAVRERRKLVETYWPQYEAAKKARDDAQQALAAANADHSAEDRAASLAAQVEAARAESRAVAERANQSAATLERFQKAGWYAVAGFGVLAFVLGVTCFARPGVRLPLGIGTVGVLGLVGFLVVALGSAERTQAAAVAGANKQDQPAHPSSASGKDGDGVAIPPPRSAKGEAAGAGSMTPDAFNTKPAAGGADLAVPSPAPRPESVTGRAMRVNQYSFQPPRLPSVESGRGEISPLDAYGMMARTNPGQPDGRGAGFGGGGLGARGLWEPGFFERFRYYWKPAAPAPQPASGIPALHAAPVSGLPSPKAGPPVKYGAIPKRFSTVPEIKLADPTGETSPARRVILGMANDAPAPAREPVALGGSAAKSKSEAETEALTSAARQYSELRAKAVGDQMAGVLAHQLNVPVDSVKKALDHLKKSEDGSPGVVGQTLAEPVADDEVRAILRMKQSVPQLPPLVIREYAAPRPGPDSATDSPDTILWQPVIVLPTDGKAKLTFPLGNAPGGYQVVVAGHTLDGRLGAVRGIIPVAPVQPTESSRPAALPGQAPPVPPPGP